MDEASKDRRSIKSPDQIRAERIAATDDPKLRQELEGIIKTRDAELARVRERQDQTHEKRVAQLRDQKIRSKNAPQLTPPGMRTPYLGDIGHVRAEREATAQIRTHDHEYLKRIAKDHNDLIDTRLDAQREKQAGRESSAQPERVPRTKSRQPNRYAELIERQNYAERAKETEPDRDKKQERLQQQQRQRGLDR